MSNHIDNESKLKISLQSKLKTIDNESTLKISLQLFAANNLRIASHEYDVNTDGGCS